MQIISAKTRLRDVPRAWAQRPLLLDGPAEPLLEADGQVAVAVWTRPRFLGRFRAPRPDRLGRIDPQVARIVAALLEARKRVRVRLVDVPAPYRRGAPGEPEIWVSVWGEVDGDIRSKIGRAGRLSLAHLDAL